MSEKKRCPWPTSHEIMIRYHDEEWGVPVKSDQRHFEFLCLESAQAGLSWLTILNKRENYRRAFAGFDPKKVAKFDKKKVAALLSDAGIVRNRLKIEAAINNAKRFIEVQNDFGSFDNYCWQFVGGKPKRNRWKSLEQIPSKTKESDAFAQDLKKRGFKFLGSTTVYSHMQATGMVNDHVVSCFRYREI